MTAELDSTEKALDAETPSPGNGKAQDAALLTEDSSTLAEKLAKADKDRRAANKEAQDAKKREADLAAKLKAYEDKEKTEIQKAQEELADARAKLESERLARLHQETLNAVIQQGATGPEADFLTWRIEREKPENLAEWLAEQKKSAPHLFGVVKTPPLATGAGGPTGSTAPGKHDKEIAEIKAQIAKTSNPTDRLYLNRALRRLESER